MSIKCVKALEIQCVKLKNWSDNQIQLDINLHLC